MAPYILCGTHRIAHAQDVAPLHPVPHQSGSVPYKYLNFVLRTGSEDLVCHILCDPLPRSCAAHRIRQTISCAQPATSCAPHRIMVPNFTGCGSHILCNPMSAQDMDRHILCPYPVPRTGYSRYILCTPVGVWRVGFSLETSLCHPRTECRSNLREEGDFRVMRVRTSIEGGEHKVRAKRVRAKKRGLTNQPNGTLSLKQAC